VKTGLPLAIDSGGQVVSTLSIFPTIMAAFGVSIPIQQITEWIAIEAALKKG
jgi:hypothetical protein